MLSFSRHGGGAPSLVSGPELLQPACAGQLCTFVPAEWDGVDPEDVTYRLEVDGTERATWEGNTSPYTFTDADEEYTGILFHYPTAFPSAEQESDPVLISLPTAFLACFDAGAISELYLYRRDDLDVILISGLVQTIIDLSGNGRDKTQGTAGNRPTPVATGMNGKAAIQFGGTTRLTRAAYSLAGITSQVLGVVASSTNTSEAILVERGSAGHSSTGGQNVTIRESNGTVVDTYAGGVASGTYSHARNNTISPATPAVYVGTADRTLSTNCTQTRTNGGGNVATSRFANSDLNGDADNNVSAIGGRSGGGLHLTGFVAGAFQAGWAASLNAGHLAQIDAGVALLKAWRGIS